MAREPNLTETSQPFLSYLEDWYSNLPTVALGDAIGPNPDHVALFSVDMVNGFCHEGPLSSDRVGGLAQPVAKLFHRAYDMGIRHMTLAQDTHDPHTPEFQAYPPHCVAGTSESETIPELRDLPFYNEMTVIPKNSLSSSIGTAMGDWVAERPQLSTFIVVGDCTDLCVYNSAMHLRMYANAFNLQRRVIVPASFVNTFDTPVSVAREAGIPAHDADLHHVLFLHHMALNGVEIVKDLT
jgi:nicotinamidase-related amidase